MKKVLSWGLVCEKGLGRDYQAFFMLDSHEHEFVFLIMKVSFA